MPTFSAANFQITNTVPEPSSFVTMALGLMGLCCIGGTVAATRRS